MLLTKLFLFLQFILFILLLRGQGSSAVVVLISLTLWGLFSLIPKFRDISRNFLSYHWKTLKSSNADNGKHIWFSALLFVGLPMLFLCLANGRSISAYDNYGMVLTSASVVEFRTTDLTPQFSLKERDTVCQESYWLRCQGKKILSAYPIGLLPFTTPIFLAARLVGADFRNHRTLWRISKLVSSILASAVVVISFFIAKELAPFKSVSWMLGFLMTGSTVLSTIGQGLWSHSGVCLGLLLTILIIRKTINTTQIILLGLAWSTMVACRTTSFILIAPPLFYLLLREPRKAVFASFLAVVFYVPWLSYYWGEFGSPLGPQALMAKNFPGGFSLANIPEGLEGLLISPGTGLLIYQPWTLLLFCSMRKWKINYFNSWNTLLWVLVGIQTIVMASWMGWTGQHCWGTRYLTEIIPVLGILLLGPIECLASHRMGKKVLALCLFVSLVIQGNGVYGPGMRWYFDPAKKFVKNSPDPHGVREINERCLDWSDPAFLYPLFR